MPQVSLVISVVAIVVSLLNSARQWRLSRHANSLRVLVDLFKEHRDHRLARARQFIFTELSKYNLDEGLSCLPEEQQLLVRDLAWYYDNLGALVVHKIVDLEPIVGYLGGSIVVTWERFKPIVEAERRRRRESGLVDHDRWQAYFEHLYNMIEKSPDYFTRARRVKSWPPWSHSNGS